MLVHCGPILGQKFKVHICNQFALECHGKCDLDAMMGELSARLDDWTMEFKIETVTELVEMHKKIHAQKSWSRQPSQKSIILSGGLV